MNATTSTLPGAATHYLPDLVIPHETGGNLQSERPLRILEETRRPGASIAEVAGIQDTATGTPSV